MGPSGQELSLLPALLGIGLLLVALLVLVYFFRGVIRTTKGCLVVVILGVLLLVLAAVGIILLSMAGVA